MLGAECSSTSEGEMNVNVTEELIANETTVAMAAADVDSIESELERFRFYTQGVLVTPVSVFGIIGEFGAVQYSVTIKH